MEALLERLICERGAAAHVVTGNDSAPRVPTLHLGAGGLSTGATYTTVPVDPGIRD